MAEATPPPQDISPGCRVLLDVVSKKQVETRHGELHSRHWLIALLERHGPMLESLDRAIEANPVRLSLYASMSRGEVGDALPLEAVMDEARRLSAAEGRSQVAERDIAAAVLRASGYSPNVGLAAAPPPPRAVQPDPVPARPAAEATAQTSAAPTLVSPPATAEPAKSAYRPRAKRPTPALEQFGLDVTQQAAQGKLTACVGRRDEMDLVIETLCRRTKRNPVLVGPAGVGKTAIVEGLALRIVAGTVPAVLKDTRLFSIQPSSLVAGSSMMGELEKRMSTIISEASQDGVLLFIDEVHSMIGSGGNQGRSDMASLLKPALARGELACLAATTDEEYRRFVEGDSALERRFQPVRVQELGPEETMQILRALRDDLGRLRDVRVEDPVLRRLVDLAASHLKNRHFPDKGVDLLEQCIAWAVANGRTEVLSADAEGIVQRIVGMPIGPAARLATLKQALEGTRLLSADDTETLVNRLQVTLRGLDVRHLRPNAVILVAGAARSVSGALAEMIASSLFGSEERVVSIDFARFTHHTDITLLLGAPPGYVGYSDNLPLHQILQTPWSVLRCENVDACHPAVRTILVQALADGFFTESRGRRVYLSDAVVILGSEGAGETDRRTMGFGGAEPAQGAEEARDVLAGDLGGDLVSQCDLVVTRTAPVASAAPQRVRALLSDLAERYRPQGLDLEWDDTVVAWLAADDRARGGAREWERLVDRHISSVLVSHLPPAGAGGAQTLRVRFAEGALLAEAKSAD